MGISQPRNCQDSAEISYNGPPEAWQASVLATTHRHIRSPDESLRPFYLGSTSYAAVFAEGQNISSSIDDQSPERTITTPSLVSSGVRCSQICEYGMGQAIIVKLSSYSIYETSTKQYFETNKASAFVAPLILTALPQLKRDIEQLVARGNGLEAACAEVTSNTSRQIQVPSSMTASKFHTLFTGPKLRWEILGLLFALSGLNAQYTSPDDPIFTTDDGRKIDREEFIGEVISGSNSCIHLCQEHGAVNDLMVWGLYANLLVQSNFYGDSYHGVWRRMCDVVGCIYAEGYHCEENVEVPFFLQEARRRVYAAAYRSDKTLSTFFGRPPMMAGRYSNRKLPLDLDDDTIATEDPNVLDAALSRLDKDGWNTERAIWPTSWIRLRKNMGVFREKVLELSLAGQTDGDLAQQLKIISDECRLTWERSPNHLQYDPSCWGWLEPGICVRMLGVYLDYLYSEFQMQRLLRRHTEAAIPALLDISMQLLTTALVLNKQRNQSYSHQRQFASIILFYCLPGAGVLALELRRCTLENKSLPESISRADLIRNLSVLISCLEWSVLPGDGNHKICNELNKMLALVLDEVLNYQPPANPGSSDGVEQADHMMFFNMPIIDGMEPIPTESENFLNWLDNANWSNTICRD